MKKELVFALSYALNKGFQIHPDAFEFLEAIDVKRLEKIIKEIVREKTKQKLFQINQDDLETYFCLLYTSPSPRDRTRSRMPSSA